LVAELKEKEGEATKKKEAIAEAKKKAAAEKKIADKIAADKKALEDAAKAAKLRTRNEELAKNLLKDNKKAIESLEE